MELAVEDAVQIVLSVLTLQQIVLHVWLINFFLIQLATDVIQNVLNAAAHQLTAHNAHRIIIFLIQLATHVMKAV